MTTDQGQLSSLERLVRFGSDEDISRFLVLLRPQDLADCVEQLEDEDRMRVVHVMSAELAGEVLPEVEEAERKEILEELPPEDLAEIVRESYSDDAADMLADLPQEKKEETLHQLEQEERRELRELMAYPEDSAGGRMQTELIAVKEDASVAEAVAEIRAQTDEVEDIHEIYVVTEGDRLVGTVGAKELVLAAPGTSIGSIMERDPVFVPVEMDQEELAHKVQQYDLPAIPVVDEGRLVGQVLVDDVLDVLEEEATEDIAQMAGVSPDEIFTDSIFRSIRARAPWLLPAFAGGLLASEVIAGQEQALKKASLLATFLPVVLGMAGNVGTQTSSITVRGLALGRIELQGAGKVIAQQFLTGVAMGAIFGVFLFLYTWLTGGAGDVHLYGVTSGVAILTSMTLGATMGILIPLTLHRLGIDPAIATSPFVQTANDVVGALVLFWVAQAVGLI